DAGHRGRLIAEAKLLRAMFYTDLLINYGPMPIVTKDLKDTIDFSSVTRPSYQGTVSFIVRDCDEALAEPNLPYRVTSEAERGRMTKAVAHAVKSQVTLFNASPQWNPENDLVKWQAAATAARQGLEDLTSQGFELFPNYENFF